MDAKGIEILLGIVGLAIVIIFSFISSSNKQKALEDSSDDSVLYLDELQSKCNLQSGGKYLLRIYRQSGNLHKDDQQFNSPEQAVRAAVTTFKRAKIECACVTKNTSTELFFRRPYHHHGGKAEGKKVGSVEIYKIS